MLRRFGELTFQFELLGLATLETSANSYVSVMPPIDVANFRLQFSQSFNGVASFTGPLIASKVSFFVARLSLLLMPFCNDSTSSPVNTRTI